MTLKLIGFFLIASALPAFGKSCEELKTDLAGVVTPGFLDKHMRCTAKGAKNAPDTALVINATTVETLKKILKNNTGDCAAPSTLKAYDWKGVPQSPITLGISSGKINHLDSQPSRACKVP